MNCCDANGDCQYGHDCVCRPTPPLVGTTFVNGVNPFRSPSYKLSPSAKARAGSQELAGVTVTQFLERLGPSSLAATATALGVSQFTLQPLLFQLTQRGCVTREGDSNKLAVFTFVKHPPPRLRERLLEYIELNPGLTRSQLRTALEVDTVSFQLEALEAYQKVERRGGEHSSPTDTFYPKGTLQ